MRDVVLETREICYTYEDGTRALNGVSVAIERGKKIALMGDNGSGKSTFFLCLNGIRRPQTGTIYQNGVPCDYSKKGLKRLRSQVGIVFQDPDRQLIIGNVRQEISFGPLNMGLFMEETRARVDRVLADWGMESFSQKPTHALSGGQKKQVAIADILVMEPEVLILDEPMASLDPLHVHLIREMIDRLSGKGMTVLIATHDVEFAFAWADEVLLFHEGTVLAQEEPAALFQNEELLKQAHLHQPAALSLFLRLQKRGVIGTDQPVPRTLAELETCIDEAVL